MKRAVFSLFAVLLCTSVLPLAASAEEPQTTYVIQKGDTLWGISDRFIRDPHYWPDLWANNPQLTNPHLIFPGQKVRVFRDRIEIEPAEVKKETVPPAPQEAAPSAAAETAKDITFTVSGGEGYLLEDKLRPAGMIVSTHLNRQIIGEDDIVYTDLGRTTGGKVGDRYSIFKKGSPISHPMTNQIVGYKVTPLGTLQIVELEDKVSKAIITKSYEEIGPGAYLMPYAEPLKTIALKSADRDLNGYIVETKSGNKTIASGDITYLDLGKNQGLQVGNMVYIIRDVYPDPKFIDVPVGKLPPEVIGAMVVVDIGPNTSTALVVKSIDTIYRGDRVEMIKSR